MQFTPTKQLDRFRGVLAAQLDSSQTTGTFVINSASALGTQLVTMPAGYVARLTIEDEHILLSAFSVSGSTVTCTIASGGRGYNGTTAATHIADTTVEMRLNKADVDSMNDHLNRFDDDAMIVQLGTVVPTITDANTMSLAGVDYTAYFPVGRVFLYKVVSTWYRATVISSSFSTNTTVEITGDGLPASGTVLSIGFEMSRSAHANKIYDLLKQCAAAPAENPPSGYVWLYLDAGTYKMKDSAGTVSSFLTDLTVLPAGSINMYAGGTVPSGWLLCNGQAVSRSTYAALFAVLNPTVGTFTITLASPGVVTLASHGLATGDSVYLTTTGALPTGLSANTRYWVIKVDANTFNLATSLANALATTAINTSGSQSGVHTCKGAAYGVGDGSTTFNVPNLLQRFPIGKDQTDTDFAGLGQTGGAQAVTLTTTELPAHTHTLSGREPVSGSGQSHAQRTTASSGNDAGVSEVTGSAGSGTAFSILNPYITLNFIIKT